MSHYISTFLYEPIIRQARRFSTPSVTAEPVDPQSNNHGSAMVDRGEAVQTSEDEESNATRPIIHHAPTISGLPEVQSPSVDDSRSITSPWEIGRDGSGNTQSARGSVSSISQTEGAGRRSVEAFPNLDHSNGFQNPPRLSSGRFRSTNTSMSSIHDSGLLGDSPRRSRRNTPQDAIIPGIGSDVNHMVDGVIPEDDGMRVMRNRIKEIQGMAISHNEKSRLMHELMTQRYKIYHPSLPPFHNPRNRSPISLRSQDRPLTPHSTNSVSDTMESTPPQTSVSSVTDQEKEYVCRVTSEDLRPTYYVRPIPLLGTVVHEATPPDSIDDPMNQEEQNDSSPPPGCVHYKRNVKLQCSACHRWYTCRFCHDAVEDHSLNRRDTKNMLCMLCGCAQPAAEECKDCGVRGAWYYCGICKLWDDDPLKSIYHCNDCGICRIGQGLGKDFYHCKTCCVCLSITIKDTHRCIERSTDCDCPICGEYMFTSPQTVVFMRCGHSIHLTCHKEHAKTSYRCPICSRSMINMEMQFRHLDRSIECQPMPEQFQDTKAWVYCNDCSAKTEVKYHWLGLKCAVCDSYNTAQISITSVPRTSPAELGSAAAPHTQRPDNVDLVLPEAVQAYARGRTVGRASLVRRPATSATALDSLRNPLHLNPSQRIARSASPAAASGLILINPTEGYDAMDIGDDIEIESSDEEDDVDFWGGESPRDRALSADRARRTAEMQFVRDDGEEDEDDDEDDDEVMEDESDDDDDEDYDHMEIFGHR